MVRSDLASLPAYVPGASIDNALKLASNEATHAPLPSVLEVIQEAATGLNRYPDMGAFQLRTAFAAWMNAQAAQAVQAGQPAQEAQEAQEAQPTLNLTADNIAVGNGSSALCQQLIQATCSHGDEVLFAWRSFEAYPILTRIAGATPVQVPLTENLRHDLPAMAAAITDRTQLIFVCNPNNPTGTTITAQEFADFMSEVPERVTVVLDEAYVEYNQAPDQPSLLQALTQYTNVAVCRTFSKAYGLAGLRLGYMAGQPELIQAVNKVGVPFGVNAIAQAAGLASLEPEAEAELTQRVKLTIKQRSRLTQWLQQNTDWPVCESEANFVWVGVATKATELDAALKKEGIVTRRFAGEGVRITVTDEKETDRLLAALERVLGS
ncbi:MAG TPA: histidinol-phosphate transaminase [Candidatus Corynebacterium gallistercoris]|uniref:Aromatic amino acid aminotransferase n=1 Tax=Candidatus Corynebacterium gallistercoris TaxID=2838530 RepID=A0A9D1RZB0_9CORY|nr:histidinol-phosphate transaminase [Candidatus Corynebacterium gallistercoris]